MNETIHFIHIPKNAGMTMVDLCKMYPNVFAYHGHATNVFDNTINNQMIIVQDPINRFKSAVRYALQKWAHDPHVKYLIEHKIDTPEKWVQIWKDPSHPEYDRLMKEIRNDGHTIGNRRLEYKWTYSPQINYVNNPKYVLMLENLDNELDVLCTQLSIQNTHERKNSTRITIENNNLSEESIAWLNEWYKDDVALYTKYKNIPLETRLSLGPNS